MAQPLWLRIEGARQNNLKNVSLDIPHDRVTVVTGVSGSGKSSLAFDTIFAEGQRRYVESLSAYARQFLERMEKPDVDRIDGISPAIAIRQKNSIRNPRSTVGTTTEIHDYMRLLFARVGRTYCRNCGKEVVRETAEVVARQLGELPAGTRLLIGFDMPVVDAAVSSVDTPEVDEMSDVAEDAAGADAPVRAETRSKGDGSAIDATIAILRRKGFARLLIDGQAVAFDDIDPASLRTRTLLQVIVDRIQLTGDDLRQRLTDSIEMAYLEGGGAAWATGNSESGIKKLEFSERFECRTCGIPYEDPQPRLFSFNNPFGACPTCHGFGNIVELDMNLVVPDPKKSIQQGAIEPWTKPHYRAQLAELKRAAKKHKVFLEAPWEHLTDEEKQFVIEGAEDPKEFAGVRGFFKWLERKKYKVHVRVFLSRYRGYLTCPDCGGARLRREARDVRVGGRTIDQVAALTTGQIASLRRTQVSTFATNQIAALTTDQVVALTTDVLPGLTTAQIAALGTAQVLALTTAQIVSLTNTQVAAFTADQVPALTTDQLQALETADVASLSSAQIAAFQTSQLVSLDNAHVGAISASALAGLSTAQMASLTTGQIVALTQRQFAALSSDQIDALSTDQIAAIETTDLVALSASQWASITTGQLQALSTSQIRAIETLDFVALTTTQIGTRSISGRGPPIPSARPDKRHTDITTMSRKSAKGRIDQGPNPPRP
jgi:excinuclease ABC subunit A